MRIESGFSGFLAGPGLPTIRMLSYVRDVSWTYCPTRTTVKSASPVKPRLRSGDAASPLPCVNRTAGPPLTLLFLTNCGAVPVPALRTPLVMVRSCPRPLESGQAITSPPSATCNVSARSQSFSDLANSGAFGAITSSTPSASSPRDDSAPVATGQTAPSTTHCRSAAISESFNRVLGGICSSPRAVTRFSKRLAPGLPGSIAFPDSPPRNSRCR